MEYANGGFRSEVKLDRPRDLRHVVHERRNGVPVKRSDRVPAVVAEVEDHHVESIREQRPKWVVRIRRKPVRMA